MSVDLIFNAPNVANLVFFKDSTENCTLKPREPRSEDKQGVLLGVALLTEIISQKVMTLPM